MTIPEHIRASRKAAGLTQRQLGEACGYEGRSAEVVVQEWERGVRPIPIERLRRLAAALDVPLDSLIP